MTDDNELLPGPVMATVEDPDDLDGDDDEETEDEDLPDDFQPGRPVLTDKPELDIPGTPDDPTPDSDDGTDIHTEDDL